MTLVNGEMFCFKVELFDVCYLPWRGAPGVCTPSMGMANDYRLEAADVLLLGSLYEISVNRDGKISPLWQNY